MTEPPRSVSGSRSVRQPVLLGLFAGTTVGVGYLFAGVPNVELMTLVVALSGAVLGRGPGFACGLLAATIYSLGSPYGLPSPLLLAAQALGLGAAGLVGARLRPAAGDTRRTGRRGLLRAALTGLLSTMSFEILTNLTIIGMFDTPWRVVLGGAVPFFLIHVGTNIVIFTILFTPLAIRLRNLVRPSLRGRSGTAALVAFMLLSAGGADGAAGIGTVNPAVPDRMTAATPADSVSAPVDTTATVRETPDESAQNPRGWQRPLWTPFAATILDWATVASPLTIVRDGGVGASARLRGEAGTANGPLVTVDGIPLGTGHVLTDGPEMVPLEGLDPAWTNWGADGWGGVAGELRLISRRAVPDRAVSHYHGVKGNHETYYRGMLLQTPGTGWRAVFAFDESLDNEGYNHTELPDETYALRRSDGFTGQGKTRQSRLRLTRVLSPRDEVWVEVIRGRRTRDDLPALGAGRLEAWSRGVSTRMTAGIGSWNLTSSLFWRGHDVEWGGRYAGLFPPSDLRLLESTRSGLSLDLARPMRGPAPDQPARPGFAAHRWRVRLRYMAWRLRDSGPSGAWADGHRGAEQGEGGTAVATAGVAGEAAGLRWTADAGGALSEGSGVAPEVAFGLGPSGDGSVWGLTASAGGRDPRSDEVLTPLLHVVDGRELAVLPNPDLDRERSLRLGAFARRRVLGLDLALDVGWRRLEDGIYWRPLDGEADRGEWSNGLEMDATRLTASVSRAGRFLGWGRAGLEGSWQDIQSGGDGAVPLPPGRYLRLNLAWENHFFQEDGILQLALLSTFRGEMEDPWDVTATFRLPSRTRHDLLLGFRLVGVHLSLGMRNLTGERSALTAGALSPGRETDLRLSWSFHQ